ncbi:hypothetical protein MYSTI_01778 [Myxococcus stipitatus DSM 14675]|uniref:Uncharacterized protein n=1 Tax=Myxococcus stipitatus (strain DSM 14675 / JCM 12634 / Mx s8) TaxID=1278073 RepID=L7U5J3_MYXSD|nr:hypothetical protein [Myxococcus stipitatus]AGC43110.1 hypothetical protein MYSTI_01778 [Myxococcus stipitatus DSM 14675]
MANPPSIGGSGAAGKRAAEAARRAEEARQRDEAAAAEPSEAPRPARPAPASSFEATGNPQEERAKVLGTRPRAQARQPPAPQQAPKSAGSAGPSVPFRGAKFRVRSTGPQTRAGLAHLARWKETAHGLHPAMELEARRILLGQEGDAPKSWGDTVGKLLSEDTPESRARFQEHLRQLAPGLATHIQSPLELINAYRDELVSDAINDAVHQAERAFPQEQFTDDYLRGVLHRETSSQRKSEWTSPHGATFRAPGSKNPASDLDISVALAATPSPSSRGDLPSAYATLLQAFNRSIQDRLGLPASFLLDANMLDGVSRPQGAAWEAIAAPLNAREQVYTQAAALLSTEHVQELLQRAGQAGVSLDPEAVELARHAREALKHTTERLRQEHPRLDTATLAKLAGTELYIEALHTVDAAMDARQRQHAAPEALHRANIQVHDAQMRAWLYASEAYTSLSAFIDVVENGQRGDTVPLSPAQYRVSAQENAWNALEHLGEREPTHAIDASKYLDRALKALHKAQPSPGSAPARALEAVLKDTEGLGTLLALRKAGRHSEPTLSADVSAQARQALTKLEQKLGTALHALGERSTGNAHDQLMTLWLHALPRPD